MFDTKFTEKQFAFQLLDFAANKKELQDGSPYFTECRKELIKLVDEQVNSANFWHDRYFGLAKEVMQVSGLPDDFAKHGLRDAFELLKKQTKALEKLTLYNEHIRDGKINYRPEDHIQVAKDALSL